LATKSRTFTVLITVILTILLTVLAYTVFGGQTILTFKNSFTSPITFPSTCSLTRSAGDYVVEYARRFLVVKVDKKSYKISEVVKITIINQGNMVIELANPPWAIYRLEHGK